MGQVVGSLGSFIYIDANIVIYAVEGFEQYDCPIKAVLSAMDRGDLVVAASELTLAEVLVKPLQDKNVRVRDAYLRFLEPSRSLTLAPISRSVLVRAAEIRASTGLKLPDAIHVATALELGCEALLTNDQSLRQAPGLRVVLVSEIATL